MTSDKKIPHVTPHVLHYKKVTMKNGVRVGKCPRGKKLKCSACANIMVVEQSDPTNQRRCLNMNEGDLRIYTIGKHEDDTNKLMLVHKDVVLFDNLSAQIEINGAITDIKDINQRNAARHAAMNTLITIISQTYSVTLISE